MRLTYLVLREGLRALADPKPHEHTEPWGGRCTKCGHRIGENVIATRDLPFWEWHKEIYGRAVAIRHGELSR